MTTNYLSTVRKWVSVEPTFFFMQFSTTIIGALMGAELFRKVSELYHDEVPAGSSAKEEDDIYKSHLIIWNIIIRASATIPVFVTGIWAGAYSQKVGRKPFIIIGSVNAGVNALGSLLVFSNFIDAPLWVLLLSSSIAGITGNITIAQLTGFSHIGDISKDKSSLAVRLVGANVAMSVATMLGGFAEAGMSGIPSAWPCVVAIFCSGIAVVFGLILLPSTPPEAQAPKSTQETSTSGCCSSVLAGIVSFFKDIASVFIAIGRKREGNKRAMLIAMCMVIFLVNAVIDDEDVVIQTYLVGEPFHWGKEKFGLFAGVKAGIKSGGSLFVAYVLKKLLKLDDALLVVIGITSCMAQAIVFGIVETDWLFYMGGVVGCCRLQVLPGVMAFADSLIEPHEIGQIYTFIAIISGFSYFLALFGLLPLYEATFKTMPWMIWAVMVGLCVLGIVIVMVTRFFWKREMKRDEEKSGIVKIPDIVNETAA